ncbi:phosphatidylinositol-specific phospholipase C1-like protein [Arenibacter sp. GZD96]|uniref:phosphatidylinositol-specific phospholipase C1-like protein n=1 Tax=Aurantibrevibacter litoralis TaxID=3106030 RepID=UPI002AFE263F|nr:phosphatidylinositol-specific phospholipase C1-like protein [Arenibacter sp. GZD-96]MEA1784772.1 phosphatidylinositol-specific phospholipase C1-like protein [Arenibacter sp. GZD-96]
MKYSILFIAFFGLCIQNGASQERSEGIPFNQIQVIGSHNSYKIAIDKPLLDYVVANNPSSIGLEYEHLPLSDQLNLGLRSLELDVFHDPEGGYYTNPKGLEIVQSLGKEPKPFDAAQKLQTPGLKVFHVQEIDFRSHQLVFTDALRELKKWSEENQGHTPIIVTLNAKDAEIPLTRTPLPFTADALQQIDHEIRSVFSEEQLITPDKVRGSFETLEMAVLTNGWPLWNEVKNRFLFVLDEGEAKTERYLQKYPHLKGAVLFVNKEEGNPEAAFRIINDPIKNFDKIKNLVHLGYMVRTRADADTKEARTNDYTRFHRAMASGAQVITTDYYIPSRLFRSSFQVIFPDGTYERVKETE